MDTSETYIKMRLAAIPELGRGCVPRSVGHEIQWLSESHEGIFIDTNGNFFVATKEGAVQLERQGQLQAMLPQSQRPSNGHVLSQFVQLDRYISSYGVALVLDSWEKLWLAFVMKEKYNKVWDGEKWLRE